MAATEKNPQELEKASKLANVPTGDEFEKMISGMLYNSWVPELESTRIKARKWMMHYNNYMPDFDTMEEINQDRYKLLKQLLGHIGDDKIMIEPPFSVDYGCLISVGKQFYANFNFTVLDCAIVTIGDRVAFGPNVSILSATHETEIASRRQGIEYALPITIGDDCWIGGQVVILPGVTIGEGCTIAAGAVVSKDIPAWSVAMGVPARVVKKVKQLEKYEG